MLSGKDMKYSTKSIKKASWQGMWMYPDDLNRIPTIQAVIAVLGTAEVLGPFPDRISSEFLSAVDAKHNPHA